MATSVEWRRWPTQPPQDMSRETKEDMPKKLIEIRTKLQLDEKEKLEFAHGVLIDIDAFNVAFHIVLGWFHDRVFSDGGNDDSSDVALFRKKFVELLEKSCMRVRQDLDKNMAENHLDELEYLLYRSLVELKEIKKEKDPLRRNWITYVEAEYESLTDMWDWIMGKWKFLVLLRQKSKRIAEGIFEMEQMRQGLVRCLQDLETTGSPSRIFELAQKLGALSAELLLQKTHEHFKQQIDVSPFVIYEVASSMTGIPTSWLENSLQPPLRSLRERLLKTVIGQKNAITAITSALLRPRRNNCSWPRPIGSFLFLCDFGVGGMELVEALAEHIYDSKDQVIRFDISDDSVLHSSPCSSCSRGIHPRDCNHKEHRVGGKLVEAVNRQPFCVLLFDNVDKANTSITDSLIDILKHGKLIDLQGAIVDFSKKLIILTSDVGKNVLRPSSCRCLEKDRDFPLKEEEISCFFPLGMQHSCGLLRVIRQASKFLKPELIDQLDDIIVLNSLHYQELNFVARLQLRDVPEIMNKKGLILYPSEAALRSIRRKSCSQIDAGLRGRAWLRENVVPSLVKLVAENELNDMCAIYIDVLIGTDEFSYRFKRGGPLDDKDFKQCKESIDKLRAIYRKEKERINKIYLFRRKYYELKSMIDEKTMEDTVCVAQVVQECVNLLDFLIMNALDVSFTCEEYKVVPLWSLKRAEFRQRERSRLGDRIAALPDGLGSKCEAVDIIANTLLRSRGKQDLSDPRPVRSFLFLGLTSVGKADLVRLVTERFVTLYGSDNGVVVSINLQEFSDPDSVAERIHGTDLPPYMMDDRAGPFCVLLVNEVEKANMSVFNALISMLDHGMLGDREGKRMVEFCKVVVVIMSEIGNKEILANLVGDTDTTPGPEEESEEKPGKRRFRTELLNRVNEIVLCNPSAAAAREQLGKVARLSMEARAHLEEERPMGKWYWSLFGLFKESANDTSHPTSSTTFIERAMSHLSTGPADDL